MNEKNYSEPTAAEMLKAIYQNIVWQECKKCGKRFKNVGGFEACYDCSQGGEAKQPSAANNNVGEEVLDF